MTDRPDIIRIAPKGKPLVVIKPDGSIEYGEGYDPDEAARIFWEAIARHAPVQVYETVRGSE